MTETEHLLACLAEECDEVGQRVMKALRFGLKEIQPGQDLNNIQRIALEVADLQGVLEMLTKRGILTLAPDHAERVAKKAEKVEHFMKYAREQGALI